MFGTPLRRFSRDSADDPQELRRDRARNHQKLKSKFERIFERYGRDFDGVGDEVDLVTGQVVVDNGHLSRMQHERDIGSTPSRRFVRAFTQELGGEDHQESRALNQLRSQFRTPAGQTDRSTAAYRQPQDPRSPQRRHGRRAVERDLAQHSSLSALAGPRSALMTMAETLGASNDVNPDAVQSLGNALATQIASFLNQQLVSQLGNAQHNPWAAPPLPLNIEAFRSNAEPGPNDLSVGLRSPTPSPGMSLWAPYDEYYDHGTPRPHSHERLRFPDSIPVDESDNAMPSIEISSIRRQRQATASSESHDDYDNEYEEDLSPYNRFLDQANYTFQTLAHGFANRATLNEKESQGWGKKEGSREINGFEWPEGHPSSVRRFTIEEDRLILKMKKQNMTSSEIARFLPGRTEGSIAVRYSRALKPGAVRYDQDRFVELEDDEDLAVPPQPRQRPSVMAQSTALPEDEMSDRTNGQERQIYGGSHLGMDGHIGNNQSFGRENRKGKRKRDVPMEMLDPALYSEPQPILVKRKPGRPRKHPRSDQVTDSRVYARQHSRSLSPGLQASSEITVIPPTIPPPSSMLPPPPYSTAQSNHRPLLSHPRRSDPAPSKPQMTLMPTIPRGPPQPFRYPGQAALSMVFSVKPSSANSRPSRKKSTKSSTALHTASRKKAAFAPNESQRLTERAANDSSLSSIHQNEAGVRDTLDSVAQSTINGTPVEDPISSHTNPNTLVEVGTHTESAALLQSAETAWNEAELKVEDGSHGEIDQHFANDLQLTGSRSMNPQSSNKSPLSPPRPFDDEPIDPRLIDPRLRDTLSTNSRPNRSQNTAPRTISKKTGRKSICYHRKTAPTPSAAGLVQSQDMDFQRTEPQSVGTNPNEQMYIPESEIGVTTLTSTPLPFETSGKRNLSPTTPINRTLLSPRKSRSGSGKPSLRAAMFRQRLSSPPRRRAVSGMSENSMSDNQSESSAMMDASDDEL